MDQERILYVCTGQGARARIAEYFTNQLSNPTIRAFSSSFEPGLIAGLPNIVMQEIGVSQPLAGAESLFERFANNEHFDHVICLCDDLGNEQCPLFRNCVKKLYGNQATLHSWSVADFRTLGGDAFEQLERARAIRDHIRHKVQGFIGQIIPPDQPALQQPLWS